MFNVLKSKMLKSRFAAVVLGCGFVLTQAAIASAQAVLCLGPQSISGVVTVSIPQDNGSGYKINKGVPRVLPVKVLISGPYSLSYSSIPPMIIRAKNNCALDIQETPLQLIQPSLTTLEGTAQVQFTAGDRAVALGRGTTYFCDFEAVFTRPLTINSYGGPGGVCGSTATLTTLPATIRWYRKV